MSKSKLLSSPKFRFVAGLILIGGAAGIGLAGPYLGSVAAHRADALVTKAQAEIKDGNHSQAIIDYQVASWLSPSNHQIIQQLATLFVSDNRPNDAVATLKRLPRGESGLQIATLQRKSGQLAAAGQTLDALITDKTTTPLLVAKSQVLLEQGRGDDAAASAQQALSYDLSNSSAQVQAGLCFAVNGQADKLTSLMVSVSSPQALQALQQAQLGKSPLAYELYAQGLLRSSRSVLLKLASLNTPEEALIGRIDLELAGNDSTKLAEAETYLVKASVHDPANLDAHQLLLQVYQKEGKSDQASHQTELIQQLQSGKV